MFTMNFASKSLLPLIVLAGVVISTLIYPPGEEVRAGVNLTPPGDMTNEEPVWQGGPLLVPGAPLKGVDVKLGRNPGGSVAQRTTDDSGKFDFGIIEKGSYFLTLSLSDKSKGKGSTQVSGDPHVDRLAVPVCLVTLNGTGAGPVKLAWDFGKSRAFDPATQTTAKAGSQEKISFQTDGAHPVNGTIVKSKSNISNN